jgi:hypothetical protein
MTLSRESQWVQELSLVKYGKIFPKLTKKQKKSILDESFSWFKKGLSDYQIEQILNHKLFGKILTKKSYGGKK